MRKMFHTPNSIQKPLAKSRFATAFRASIAINAEEWYKLDVTMLVFITPPNISYNMGQLRIEFHIYFHLLPAYLLLYLKFAKNTDINYIFNLTHGI